MLSTWLVKACPEKIQSHCVSDVSLLISNSIAKQRYQIAIVWHRMKSHMYVQQDLEQRGLNNRGFWRYTVLNFAQNCVDLTPGLADTLISVWSNRP